MADVVDLIEEIAVMLLLYNVRQPTVYCATLHRG